MADNCQHCRRRKVTAKWTVRPCALGRTIKMRLCAVCDVTLNAYVLRFVKYTRLKSVMKAYRRKVYG